MIPLSRLKSRYMFRNINLTVVVPYFHLKRKGSFLYMHNTSFIIKSGNHNHDSIPKVMEVITDETGRFTTQLASGIYSLLFPDKGLSFKAFYEKISTESIHLLSRPESCFKTWWQSLEAILQVTDSSTHIRSIIKNICDTGFNPCMNYTGPKRS